MPNENNTDSDFFQQVFDLPIYPPSNLALQDNDRNNPTLSVHTSVTSDFNLPLNKNNIIQLDNPKIIPSEGTFYSPLRVLILNSNTLMENKCRIIYTIDNSIPDLITNTENTKIYDNKPIDCKKSGKYIITAKSYGINEYSNYKPSNIIKSYLSIQEIENKDNNINSICLKKNNIFKQILNCNINYSNKNTSQHRDNLDCTIINRLTFENLICKFHLPIKKAAKELNICTTMLKRTCRAKGIKRWPSRKINAISKKREININTFLNDHKYRDLINDIVYDKSDKISNDKCNISDDCDDDFFLL